ncbi:glycine--tRNA ligase subunit alpha [bacterium endosymbiont of Pedicinus badii]|uniref:glycine--tRNA ligase subunit alpha n=1 Tax=bacterium endosymbiont of Pedicinus badii TaxID=1719126 RepID=UPI0009BBE206|nr:glycine--tRNA ligase subunit alpha [bacterium endosymbiont of Pedicinus badii]OQM34077.1 glycyl-tRNA synthetase [bacterium endosymbiont of Pedicinus badii]
MNRRNCDTFQKLVISLHKFWISKGYTLIIPFDMEVGAGTSHPITYFSAINPNPIRAVYIQPSRRPIDGRYGKNPYRSQFYYQFQVIVKPSPIDIQDLYLESLKSIGIKIFNNDIKFLEDNWENFSLSAVGKGWEIRLNGVEITQFTYFQKIANIDCNPVLCEITYGLERIAMHIQNTDSIQEIVWNKNNFENIKYHEIHYNKEFEQSKYNFEFSNEKFLNYCLYNYIDEAKNLIKNNNKFLYSSYEQLLKAIHTFNLIEAKNKISQFRRKKIILELQSISKKIAKLYFSSIKKRN